MNKHPSIHSPFLTNEQLLKILNTAPAIIYVSDNSTKTIRWCNQYMEKITGYTLDEMHNLSIHFFESVMHPNDFPKAKEARDKFKQGNHEFSGFCRLKKKGNKEWIWLYGTAVPFSYDIDGNIKEVVCDFLELKRINTPIQMQKAFNMFEQKAMNECIQKLTRREKEIFELMLAGKTGPEITTQLLISTETLKTHKRRISSKLGKFDLRLLVNLATICREEDVEMNRKAQNTI